MNLSQGPPDGNGTCVATYSHPYRHELATLRHCLATAGYHPTACDAIATYAAAEGTIEGAPGLDPVDRESAESAFVGGMESVPLTSPEWDEFNHWTGNGPRYRSTGGAWVADAWAWVARQAAQAWDRLCFLAAVHAGELEGWEPFHAEAPEPDATDRAWLAECLQLPPIAGASPDPDGDFPRDWTAAERAEFASEIAAWYRSHPDA